MTKSVRIYTLAYCVALTVVAILSVAIHVGESVAIADHKKHSTIINVAGQQRMLSQRISYLELRLADLPEGPARAEAAEQLTRAIDLMEKNHARLRTGDLALGAEAPLAKEFDALYVVGGLDRQVVEFIRNARFILTDTPDHRREAALSLPSTELLRRLNHAVELYEENAGAEVEWLQQMTKWAAAFILVVLVGELLLIFRPAGRRLAALERELNEYASTDPLTGCLNRRGLMESAKYALAYHARNRMTIGVITFDIDHFKKVNDAYGHAVGDDVIKFVVGTAASCVRKSDIVGRTGGEEFVVFCPKTDLEGTHYVAEKVRQAIADRAYQAGGISVSVTASFGVTAVKPHGKTAPRTLIDRADQALYEAKNSGRNKTVMVPYEGAVRPKEKPQERGELAAA